MESGESLNKPNKEASVFGLVWQSLMPRERRIAVVLLLGQLFAVVLETFSIGLVLPIVGVLTSDEYSTTFPLVDRIVASDMSRESLVMSALLLMFIAHILKSLYIALLVWFQRGFMEGLSTRLSKRLFTNYLRQPYEFHLENNSSTLIRNAQNGPVFVTGGIDPMSTLLADGLVGLGLFTLLMYVEPIGTLIVGAVFGLSAWGFQKMTTRRIVKWGVAAQDGSQLVIQHLNQGLGGIKDVKILGKEDEFVDQYATQVGTVMSLQRLYKFLQALPRLWLEIITMGGLTALVGLMLLQGNEISSVLPVVGLFAATTFRVVPSINRIVASIQSLDFNRPIIREISRDLRLEWETSRSNGVCPPIASVIRVHAASFRYRRSPEDVLSGVSIEVKRGDAVGIIGASGAGKSTLVDVVLGLIRPTSGSVSVDGFDIANDPAGWRCQVGYVPQSIFLTDDSIERNVAFGVHPKEIDREAVGSALRSAMLDQFVSSLPDGVHTVVGERGVRLSGGQRQRLGIARALYRNPSVLVLDEATSSLDEETERGVMEAIEALHGDKTIIVIAHRLSTIRYCDWVYRMERGRVVHEGTYENVVGVGG